MIPKLFCLLVVVAILFASSASAREIKVDINDNNRPVNDGLEVDPSSITNIVGSGQSPARIELTGESGRTLTVQSKTNLTASWLDWTNVTGSGAMLLLPLNSLTNQTPRYFRAYAQ